MGTTHNFDTPAASTLSETDTYASINATTSRGAYVTGAQLRRFMSGGLVTLTGNTTLTAATHAGRTLLLGEVGGNAALTATLPAASGTGDKYRFVVTVVNTSNYLIKVVGNDVMYGNVITNSTVATPDLGQPWPTAADSDTITMNGTTTGGVAIGDWIELQDIAADTWAVTGLTTSSGTVATPFSATVT